MPTEMYVTASTSYADVLDYATKGNLDNASFNQLLLGVLTQSVTKPKRTFAYGETLPANEAACAPVFARSFVHIDWIDGESVVQAEETSIEAGFNNRFHKIEDDFDAMNADVRKLFECLAELRHDLAARLEEIRVELNRINTDLAECCGKETGTGPVIVPWDPRYPWENYYPPRYPNTPIPDPVGPIINPGRDRVYPVDIDYIRYIIDKVKGPDAVIKPWFTNTGTPFEVNTGDILRSTNDPGVAIISGMRGQRISTDIFNGKAVEVWSTPAGVVLTPADASVTKGTSVGWTNPHVAGAGAVLGWTTANASKMEKQFGGREFTVGQLSAAFGEERLAGGMQLKTYLDQLPSGATVKSAGQVAQMVIDRAGANVLRDRAADETLIGMVGLNTEASPGKVVVATMRSVPAKSAAQLERGGIATVADLAKADPAKLAELGGVSLDTAAGWAAEANVMSGLLAAGRG
jgi:hypothetical protein